MKKLHKKEELEFTRTGTVVALVLLALSVVSLLRAMSIQYKLDKALSIYIKNNKPPKKQKYNQEEDCLPF